LKNKFEITPVMNEASKSLISLKVWTSI